MNSPSLFIYASVREDARTFMERHHRMNIGSNFLLPNIVVRARVVKTSTVRVPVSTGTMYTILYSFELNLLQNECLPTTTYRVHQQKNVFTSSISSSSSLEWA